MKLPFESTSELELAVRAASEAGKAVSKIYDGKVVSTLKSDNEPLTEADIQSNEIIQKIISQSGHAILSEESLDDKTRLNRKKIWVVDPLDGTNDFINKTGEFTIMIALVENKKPSLGVIYWPIMDILYLAQKGKGAFQLHNGDMKRLSVSSNTRLEKCSAVGSRFHISNIERDFLTQLKVNKFISRGSSLKVVDICAGIADLYFTTTSKIKHWDTCASYCLITEAGGKITDMFGNDLEYNTELLNHQNGLLVTNGLIHDQIVNAYEQFLHDGN